jgi:hypothetical protein
MRIRAAIIVFGSLQSILCSMVKQMFATSENDATGLGVWNGDDAEVLPAHSREADCALAGFSSLKFL